MIFIKWNSNISLLDIIERDSSTDLIYLKKVNTNEVSLVISFNHFVN